MTDIIKQLAAVDGREGRLSSDICVIGVGGKAGSGKTTFSGVLSEEIRIRLSEYTRSAKYAHTYALASPLVSAITTLGWTGTKDARYRRFINKVSDAALEYSPDLLLQCCRNSIFNHSDFVNIITDVRTAEEARMLQEDFGGFVIYLFGRGRDEEDMGEANEHRTEAGVPVDYVDFVIDNGPDTKVEDLHKAAADVADIVEILVTQRRDFK